MNSTKPAARTMVKVTLLAVFCTGLFLLRGSAGETADAKPQLVISPAQVDYKPKTKVTLEGSGFKPKQELGIEVEMGGTSSDVSYLMKPRPVADEKGTFKSEWVLAGEIKLLKPTTHKVAVVDQDGKVLTTGTLDFKKPEPKAAKKK